MEIAPVWDIVISQKALVDAHLKLFSLTSGIYQYLMSLFLGIISIISLHISFP